MNHLLPEHRKLTVEDIKSGIDRNIADYGAAKVRDTFWHLLDWNSVTKHCFYGASFKEYDPETDKKIPTVGGAMRFFFDVYGPQLFSNMGTAPINVILAKDGGIDFRKGIFPGYKAKREARKAEQVMDQEMKNLIQFKKVLEDVLVYSGSTAIKVKGVEADDVIAWCCQGLQGDKFVYTNDHDLLALAEREDVTAVLKGRWKETNYYDVDKSVERPFPLRYVTLFKSLVGDASDEYGGVKSFGPAKWNDLYAAVGDGGLDELVKAVTTRNYKNIEAAAEHDSTPKQVKKALSLILKDAPNWQTMYTVASLRPQLCWRSYAGKITKPDFRKRVPSRQRVTDLMASVGCTDVFEQSLKQFMPTETLIHSGNWSDDMPGRMAQQVAGSPLISYDYEGYDTLQHEAFQQAKSGSTYLDVVSMEATGASVCFGSNCQHSVYLTVEHDNSELEFDNLEKTKLANLLTAMRDACRGQKKPYVAHNAQFEMALSVQSLDIEMWDSHDSMILSQEVDENERSGLKHLASTWLRYRQTEFSEVVPEGKTMADVSAVDVLHYGCDDSLVTSHLYWLEMIISQLESTYDFYCEYNVAPLNILAAERLKGVKMDWDTLNRIKAEDAETHASSQAAIEKLLQENLDKNADGDFIAQLDNANKFFNADKDYYYCKARSDASKAWDKLQEKIEDLRAKADEGAELDEYEQLAVDGNFTKFIGIFTEDRIDKVKGNLMSASLYRPYKRETVGAKFHPTAAGLRDLSKALELPVIEKATKGYLNLYLDDNWQEFATEDQKEFARLLEAVVPVITSKDREEPEFRDLETFAIRVMGLEGKEVETGFEITTSSPVKSRNLLYLLLGSEVYLRGKTSPGSLRRENKLPGAPSANALAYKWADAHTDRQWVKDVLANLVKMSAAATRDGLYHKKYPMWKHPKTGNIHPEFRWCATATGRPTGGNPNFLQISPVMRQTVIPAKEGDVLVGIDWAGLELRLTAGQSCDATMIKAYIGPELVEHYRNLFGDAVADRLQKMLQDSKGLIDLHSATGASIVGWSYEDFYAAYKDEDHPDHEWADGIRKKKAKVINFGLIYGMSSMALSEKMIIDRHESDGYVDAYFRTYPGVVEWQSQTEAEARRNGFTKTAFGSIRHAEPELMTGDRAMQARIARQLINAEIQGSAADLLKITLSGMWKSGLYAQAGCSYVLPIYDEVLSSVDEGELELYIAGMRHLMEVIVPTRIPVPMETDVAVGYDWFNMAELGSSVNDIEAVKQKLAEKKAESTELHVEYDLEVEVTEDE